MELFKDFKQKLIDLKGKRVRLCFYLPEITKHWGYVGRIQEVDENTKSLVFETDPQTGGDYPVTISHFNLESIIIYTVDQLDEDADLSDKPDPQDYVAEYTEYIPYDKEGKPIRMPQEGYVILHKDHIYAKGTVYTKLREKEQDSGDKPT